MNSEFGGLRQEYFDIAIVARVSDVNMHRQDVDNIAKVVLDALKEEQGDSRFLFYDDSQVLRLLLYKMRSKIVPGYNTDSLTISFRIHEPNKQMLLVDVKQIGGDK